MWWRIASSSKLNTGRLKNLQAVCDGKMPNAQSWSSYCEQLLVQWENPKPESFTANCELSNGENSLSSGCWNALQYHFFFHLAFLMPFLAWFLAEVLPHSPHQSKKWLSSPFQKERGFPQRKKFPCSHNTTNSLFSTHVQALTWGRKNPLHWCCNLIPSLFSPNFISLLISSP